MSRVSTDFDLNNLKSNLQSYSSPCSAFCFHRFEYCHFPFQIVYKSGQVLLHSNRDKNYEFYALNRKNIDHATCSKRSVPPQISRVPLIVVYLCYGYSEVKWFGSAFRLISQKSLESWDWIVSLRWKIICISLDTNKLWTN